MKTIAIFVLSWAAGLVAYLGALALLYRQSVSFGDLAAVVFWSLLAFGVAFFLLYMPAMFVMKRWLRGVRPLWPFPLLAFLLGIVPAALVVIFLGGDVRSLTSPEASLFYCMFGASGVVAGIAYAFINRPEHSA